MIWHRGPRREGRVAEARKIFCVFAVKLVWGQENEGDTRRSTAWGWISHGRRSELKHGFRVGRARKCILSALYLGAEFLFELRFLSKGRETIDRYMANFCAAHVRTDVNKKPKNNSLCTAYQKHCLQTYGSCSVGLAFKSIKMYLLCYARRWWLYNAF